MIIISLFNVHFFPLFSLSLSIFSSIREYWRYVSRPWTPKLSGIMAERWYVNTRAAPTLPCVDPVLAGLQMGTCVSSDVWIHARSSVGSSEPQIVQCFSHTEPFRATFWVPKEAGEFNSTYVFSIWRSCLRIHLQDICASSFTKLRQGSFWDWGLPFVQLFFFTRPC